MKWNIEIWMVQCVRLSVGDGSVDAGGFDVGGVDEGVVPPHSAGLTPL